MAFDFAFRAMDIRSYGKSPGTLHQKKILFIAIRQNFKKVRQSSIQTKKTSSSLRSNFKHGKLQKISNDNF